MPRSGENQKSRTPFNFDHYPNVGLPVGDRLSGVIDLPFSNTGRLPASPAEITIYAVRERFPKQEVFSVCRRKMQNTLGIQPGNNVAAVEFALPNWNPAERTAIQQRNEAIFLGVEIRYGDGFPEDGRLVYHQCTQTWWENGAALRWPICQDRQMDWLKTDTEKHPANR